MTATAPDVHDPVTAIKNARWICRGCAYWTRMDPMTLPKGRCPDCHEKNWFYTIKPAPKV